MPSATEVPLESFIVPPSDLITGKMSSEPKPGATRQPQQSQQKTAKYAVVELAPGTDPHKFVRNLAYLGQAKVSLLNEVHDHPNVKNLLSFIIDEKGTVDLPAQLQPGCQPTTSSFFNEQKARMNKTTSLSPSTFTVDIIEKTDANITLNDFLKSQLKKNRWSQAKEDMVQHQQDPKPIETKNSFDQTIDRVVATWNDPKTIQVNEPKDPAIISEIFRKQNILVAAANAKRINENLPDEESSKYMMCKLCNSKIMISRYSNLANHVKRHSSVKQYQCAYCGYQNNEQAKVRLHMSSQHQDSTTNPLDHFTTKLQKTWSLLMEQCFPDYIALMGVKDVVRRKSERGREKRRYEFEDPDSGNSNQPLELEGFDMKDEVTCFECFQSFLYTVGEEFSQTGELCTHLKINHAADCIPYQCDYCNHLAPEEWKVRLHIAMSHSDEAAEVTVSKSQEPSFELFVSKYFPRINNDKEKDEDGLTAIKTLEDLVNGIKPPKEDEEDKVELKIDEKPQEPEPTPQETKDEEPAQEQQQEEEEEEASTNHENNNTKEVEEEDEVAEEQPQVARKTRSMDRARIAVSPPTTQMITRKRRKVK